MRRTPQILPIMLALASVTSGAKESSLNVDFFCGWEGCYRPMEWTPVEIGISSDLTTPFAGSVTVSAQQDGLNTMNVVHNFVLTPDLPLHLPLVTKLAFGTDKCSVRVANERGRTRWHHDFSLWDLSGRNQLLKTVTERDLLIGLIGPGKFGLIRLDQQSVCRSPTGVGKVYLAAKVPRMAPWDWTGFACLDLLILYNPDWKLFNQHQLSALAQWISNGGRLLLVLGSNPLPAENPVVQLLPFRVENIREVTLPAQALVAWQLEVGLSERVAAWPLVCKPGSRLWATEDYGSSECLFGTGYVGFGRVGVLAFDPSMLSDPQRARSVRFWVGRIAAMLSDEAAGQAVRTSRISRGGLPDRTIEFVQDPDAVSDNQRRDRYYQIGLAQAASNAVMEHLYNIPEMRPLSIWWVILLLSALAVLLGPVDYFVLKRRDRLPLTWLTCAGWITLFTAGAYYGVQALRGGKMQLRVVSVLDGIENSMGWSSTYCGLFAPYSDDFQLEGLHNEQWWSGIAPSQEAIWAYQREPITRNIYCYQHDGGNLPYSLPINIWTIQCLLTESPVERLPLAAQVRRNGRHVVLEIANESDSPIRNGYVLFDDNQTLNFGSVPGRATKRFEGELATRSVWATYGSDGYRSGSYRGRPVASLGSIRSLGDATTFFAQGCLQRTQGIRCYLARGAAVVCAQYQDVPVPFSVKDCSYQYQHVQLVRQVIFPNEHDEETRHDQNAESL